MPCVSISLTSFHRQSSCELHSFTWSSKGNCINLHMHKRTGCWYPLATATYLHSHCSTHLGPTELITIFWREHRGHPLFRTCNSTKLVAFNKSWTRDIYPNSYSASKALHTWPKSLLHQSLHLGTAIVITIPHVTKACSNAQLFRCFVLFRKCQHKTSTKCHLSCGGRPSPWF